MKLAEKETQILTYFEHGVRKNDIIKKLRKFFSYNPNEIKQIFEKLRKKKLIKKINSKTREMRFYIISEKVTRDMLDDEVKYVLEQSSKFRTFRDFLKQKETT